MVTVSLCGGERKGQKMEKSRRIPVNTFQQIGVNAGVLAFDFDTATGAIDEEDLMGATSGGVTFNANQTFTDYGEDIDNCPKNTKELMRPEEWAPTGLKYLRSTADHSGSALA